MTTALTTTPPATPAKTATKSAAKKTPSNTVRVQDRQTHEEQMADNPLRADGPRSDALALAIQQQGSQYVLDGKKLKHEPRRRNSVNLDGRVWSPERDAAEAEEAKKKHAAKK